MSKKIKSNYGNCYQCGKTFSSTEIKKHILKEHNTGNEESFLIQVESADFYDYWLYIDIPKSKKIEYIDKFLRNIWLECCGHMSRFAASYNSQNNIGKSRTVGSFKAGDEIYYEYDMGTTTALLINFIGEIKRPKQTNSVRLLARNKAPELNCTVCGSTADFICTECMYNSDEIIGSLFCGKHSEQHEHDDMMMPIVNSPRSGECGYTGEDDFYEFTGDLKRDQETSVGKIRRYGWFKTENNDKVDDKTKNTGGFEIVKSNNTKKMDIESLIDRFLSENYDEPDITDDTGEELLEMFTEFADNLVIKSRPFFTLKELFSKQSLSELKEIAKMVELKNYYKMKKNELVDFIIKELTKIEKLENLLSILSEEEFELFNDLLEKDYHITDKNIFSNILILCSYVFLLFYFEGKYYNVVPKEIKEIYKTSINENFLEKRKKIQDFTKIARAAANLYGIITIKDFINILNRYNNDLKIDYEAVEKTLDSLSVKGEPYEIFDGYLINSSIYDSDNSDSAFNYISDLQKDKPRYLPEKEEFIKYENINYYEETPEVKDFKEYLKKNGIKNAEQLEEIFLDMNWNIRNGLSKPLDFINILNGTGFKFKSQNMSKKAIEFAIKMYNNTRMWINNGYSASEMGNLMR